MIDEPAERDVEALASALYGLEWDAELHVTPRGEVTERYERRARRLLASDWYAERIAQARADAEASARQAWDVHAEHVDRTNVLMLHRDAVAEERIDQVRREGAAEVLTEAAHDLEGCLGITGTPRDLWEFRQWLCDRAAALRGDA